MKTIDIIIPVYNEEDSLDTIIKKIEKTDYCGLKKHLIFIDDCSTDKSKEILEKYPQYTLICHSENQGKGAAICTGLKETTSDIVIIQDADLEYEPCDYQQILPSIISRETEVCYGSRFIDNSNKKSFIFLSFLANSFLTYLTNILYRCQLTDMETCYKAFNRDVLKNIDIKSKKFEFEVEITAKIIKNGFKIKEVPISYNGRSWDKGKKITGLDGLHAIFALFYYRFFN